MTKLDWMKQAAREVGLCIDTWSPGDNLTRYRFFEIRTNRCKCFDERIRTPQGCDPITEINHHLFHWHNPESGKTERDYKAQTAGSCQERGCDCKAFDPIVDEHQD